MIEKDTLIKVRNRNKGTVGYTIPDLGNLHRNFQPSEIKEVPMEELRKLSWIPGGRVLLEDYLVIEDAAAIKELLNVEPEPEYYYTEDDIIKLLNEGSMDQFLDCLEFAPDGTIQLIKEYAVKLELNDIRKRKAILDKTGFDVNSAIEINRESAAMPAEGETEKARRAQPVNDKGWAAIREKILAERKD